MSNRDELIPGSEIEIAAGYHNDNETVFRGVVVKHGIRAKPDKSTYLTVECKDKAYSATLGPQNRYFTDTTDTTALEEILDAHGLDKDVEASEVEHRTLVQYSTTDWDFLVSRAEANGRLVIVDDGLVRVGAPDTSTEPAATLLYGATILSFELSLDATHQYGEVACIGWDPANQEVVQGDAAAPGIEEPGNLSSDALVDATVGSVRYGHTGSLAAGELEAWASARKLKNTLSKVRGIVQCKGLAQVKPGTVVELAGVGDRFNGTAFVCGVCHVLSDGAWDMSVQVGLGPELFGSEVDVSEPSAAALLPAISGLQIGIVTQLQDDPDGEHRILVRMPVLDAEAEGTWARIASLDAGDGRGAFFRPEIGDEVVLGFLNDDPRQPIVLGMLNSSAKPAPLTEADDNHEKGFFSRDELKLVFNDELLSIRLETPGGNSIELSEDAGSIAIADQNDNTVELTSDGITLTSAGDISITAQGDITLEGSNVDVTAQSNLTAAGSAGCELSSSGTTDVKGSIVNIN